MGPDIAQRLLKRLLDQLPQQCWWLVRQKTECDLGIAKAFNLRRHTIDALLINTGIYKETGHGFCLIKKEWERFCATLPEHIKVKSCRSVFYISNGSPPDKSLVKQEKSGVRSAARRTLAAHIQAELESSARSYDERKAAAFVREQAKNDAAEEERRADAAKKAAAIARKVIFPLLSQVVGPEEEISLENPVVDEWCNSAFAELLKLYSAAGRTLSTRSANGKQKSFLQIPRSSGRINFMKNACKTQWLARAAELGAGDGMSAAESACCIRDCLARLFPTSVSESIASAPEAMDPAEVKKGSSGIEPEIEVKTPPKKRTRNDVRMEAAKVLAPRFSAVNSEMEWMPTEKSFSSASTTTDAKDLKAVLIAISRADPTRAANALVRTLSDELNQVFKAEFEKLTNPKREVSTEELILEGIQKSIKHHTKQQGSRNTASETFVKNVCTACLFHVAGSDNAISTSALARVIGATPRQVELAREQALNLQNNNTLVTALERKRRKDCIRDKFKPYVYDFLTDDCYTQVDTSQGPIGIIDPRTGKEICQRRRIWCNINKEQQHLLFLESDHYAKFRRENNGATATSKCVWLEALRAVGSFVRNPRPDSCMKETNLGKMPT